MMKRVSSSAAAKSVQRQSVSQRSHRSNTRRPPILSSLWNSTRACHGLDMAGSRAVSTFLMVVDLLKTFGRRAMQAAQSWLGVAPPPASLPWKSLHSVCRGGAVRATWDHTAECEPVEPGVLSVG